MSAAQAARLRSCVLSGDTELLRGQLEQIQKRGRPHEHQQPQENWSWERARIYEEPIRQAIVDCKLEMLDLLLQAAGSMPAALVSDIWAAGEGPRTSAPRELFRIVLKHPGALDLNETNMWDQAVWQTAITERDDEVLRDMLSYGANRIDVNKENERFGSTPLDEAAETGSIAAFNTLLAYGANISLSDALYYAAGSNSDFRDESDDNEYDENWRTRDERIMCMLRYLVEDLECDVNALCHNRQPLGITGFECGPPICAALRARKYERVEYLLLRGARLDVVARNGETPLQFARKRKLWSGLNLLQEWQKSHIS